MCCIFSCRGSCEILVGGVRVVYAGCMLLFCVLSHSLYCMSATHACCARHVCISSTLCFKPSDGHLPRGSSPNSHIHPSTQFCKTVNTAHHEHLAPPLPAPRPHQNACANPYNTDIPPRRRSPPAHDVVCIQQPRNPVMQYAHASHHPLRLGATSAAQQPTVSVRDCDCAPRISGTPPKP